MRYLISFLLLIQLPLQADDEPHFNFTDHSIECPSGPLSYTAITGTLPLFENEEKTADIFFIGYLKEEEENSDRPITFVFPGGPGGAGTLESIVTFGPRRLLTATEGRSILPPYKIIDNPETILEFTDLVFVDPVNCGFSKSADEKNNSYFYSIEGDIQSLGQFVHTFVNTFQKWNSPKYLAGGSYGTLRCCGLASNLMQYDILVNGIIIDGCAIEWATLDSERDRALPDCLLIPTFAATAWHYGRLWPEKPLEEVVDYARRFAYDEYAPAMLQPSRLSPFEQKAFYQELAHLIGLPLETVQKYNARIDEKTFVTEFLSPERKILGGIDTRYSGDLVAIHPYDDPQDPSYKDSKGLGCALNVYLQKELDTHLPLNTYIGFSWEAITKWDPSTYDSRGEPSFLHRMRRTLIRNPQMKVFVGSGYYDCRTPFAATEYSFDHLDLPPSYQKNLQFEYYLAGHGFVLDHASLQKFKKDLVRFYNTELTH
ncbi:MAG: hypothetical protein V4487_03090 [Chlamydiota bacterium]